MHRSVVPLKQLSSSNCCFCHKYVHVTIIVYFCICSIVQHCVVVIFVIVVVVVIFVIVVVVVVVIESLV